MTQISDISKAIDPETEAAQSFVDKRTEGEYKEEEQDLLKRQIEYLKAQTDDLKQMTGLRTKFADKVYWFLVCWSGAMFILVSLSALKRYGFQDFEIPNTVLTVLVGSTTISAIGLVGFITKGLFSVSESKKKDR